jgi:hypothetical protein
MGPNFRQYQDVSDDAQAHVPTNTGVGPMFWVCSGDRPKMCIRASPVIASKKRKQFGCIMMACEKGILWSCKLGIGWMSFQMHCEKKNEVGQ